MKKLISVSLIALLLDQIVKTILNLTMEVGKSIRIIPNFFNITLAHNYGAAWSILGGARIVLILIALLVLISIYFFFIKDKELTNIDKVTYGLLIGGIIGNLLDRIIYGYVIDYLDFNILGYDYPIFNIADICIVVSVFILIITTIKGEKHDNK